jgi:hypothetical protein
MQFSVLMQFEAGNSELSLKAAVSRGKLKFEL